MTSSSTVGTYRHQPTASEIVSPHALSFQFTGQLQLRLHPCPTFAVGTGRLVARSRRLMSRGDCLVSMRLSRFILGKHIHGIFIHSKKRRSSRDTNYKIVVAGHRVMSCRNEGKPTNPNQTQIGPRKKKSRAHVQHTPSYLICNASAHFFHIKKRDTYSESCSG